ncbi:stress protein, tellurium resistance protein TerZ [Campylobacter gastrosuis]|uniref:Stress protein, tellurium resistance protein TerZ n=1 Tax=Campylobacter gastrosuis TaxID=2974576 RepID=A0ABT7HRL6_9BACT|nr:stress protein, tellurium resistance protein TerZ [Campylobacter gastrosuis]MDL0089551.1 stress protein, tellurium resistance protein TerZ [Campylobacter gastrosuis]
MHKLIILPAIAFILSFCNQTYKIPPTSSTSGYVPVISDKQMKECVKIYNKIERLGQYLNTAYVNQYSLNEVNTYNNNLQSYNKMVDWYNLNCADKQSKSACEAAKKLNQENGLPYQECGY